MANRMHNCYKVQEAALGDHKHLLTAMCFSEQKAARDKLLFISQ